MWSGSVPDLKKRAERRATCCRFVQKERNGPERTVRRWQVEESPSERQRKRERERWR
jgi:hypothetical protein